MKSTIKVALAVAASSLAIASAFAEDRSGMYLTDSTGQLATTGFGLCLRTGSWTAPTPEVATQFDCRCEKVCPVVALPEVQVVPKIILPTDTLFAYNKSKLQKAGKDALNAIISDLDRSNVEVITVTGHTDRFGSVAYNKKLSEKRAAAVKNYLVAGGVSANIIFIDGMGESMPVSKGCVGKRATPSVKKCLQPDRRVEIEIFASIK